MSLPERRSPWFALALFCAATMLGGCGPADAPGISHARRDTLPDGRVVVSYPGLPGAEADSLVPDLRIGSVAGEGPELFGDVRGIEVGRDGTIFVLDYQAAELRAFGPDGEFRSVLAHRGEGPGELTQANGMVRDDDGTLWVQDHGHRAIIGISPDGGEVARHPMMVLGFAYMWNAVLDDHGRIWQEWGHSELRSGPPEPGMREGSSRRYLKSYDPEIGSYDSVSVGEVTTRSYTVSIGEGYALFGPPFQPGTLTAVDPAGGFWIAWTGRYRVARLDQSGDTVLVVDVAAEGPPITSADRDGLAARYQRLGEAQANRVASAMLEFLPERKPVLEQIFVDEGSRLWVRRALPVGERIVYDVFDAEGEHIVSVRPTFRPSTYFRPVIREGSLFTLVADELDVPFVVRAPLPFVDRPLPLP